MDERNLETEQTLARLRVDELRALTLQRVECGANVVDLVRDVVHPGPARREEAADGRVVAERGEQLHASGADEHRRRLDSLFLDGRAMLDAGAEQPRIGSERFVEVVDGDAEMMNAACVHASDRSGTRRLSDERAARRDRRSDP